MAPNRPRPATTDAETNVTAIGEPLTYHGPGWSIETDRFEVICWAPGEIVHNGNPIGRTRTEWMLSVSIDPEGGPPAHLEEPGLWSCGGFMSGETLAKVLPALAILKDADRFQVTAVLVHQLGGAQP